MSMNVLETLITANKFVSILMGATVVLATLDTHSIVMAELAEVGFMLICRGLHYNINYCIMNR